MQAKDINELMQLQSEFLRNQFGTATEQFKVMTKPGLIERNELDVGIPTDDGPVAAYPAFTRAQAAEWGGEKAGTVIALKMEEPSIQSSVILPG
jgi:hypothetical protein